MALFPICFGEKIFACYNTLGSIKKKSSLQYLLFLQDFCRPGRHTVHAPFGFSVLVAYCDGKSTVICSDNLDGFPSFASYSELFTFASVCRFIFCSIGSFSWKIKKKISKNEVWIAWLYRGRNQFSLNNLSSSYVRKGQILESRILKIVWTDLYF